MFASGRRSQDPLSKDPWIHADAGSKADTRLYDNHPSDHNGYVQFLSHPTYALFNISCGIQCLQKLIAFVFWVTGELGQLTLGDVTNEFLALKKIQKVREQTLSDYKKHIDKFLAQSQNTLDVDVLNLEIAGSPYLRYAEENLHKTFRSPESYNTLLYGMAIDFNRINQFIADHFHSYILHLIFLMRP